MKSYRYLLVAVAMLTLAACTMTPTKLTVDQSVRLDQAKEQCKQESTFPKVHPAESRNQSGVRTEAYYDCMRKAGFTES